MSNELMPRPEQSPTTVNLDSSSLNTPPAFKGFLRAVGEHWVTLMSGGVIIVLIGLLERLIGRNVPLSVYLSIISLFVIIACFTAWKDERSRAISISKHLEEEKAANRRPELHGSIQSFTIFPVFSAREDEAASFTIQESIETGFEITLNVRFVNVRPTGTTIRNFGFELKQTFTTYTGHYAQEGIIRRETLGKTTDERLNNLADLITDSIPVEYGRAQEGFLRFRFEKSFIHRQYVNGDELTVTITDDFGGQHVLRYAQQEFTRPSQRLLAERAEN
jgi:hypothetical protein